MKFFLCMLLILFLVSCNSPEHQIIKSFNNQRGMMQKRSIKVLSAYIYDTIYISDVNKKLPILEEKINETDKALSVELLSKDYEKIRHLRRQLDDLKQIHFYYLDLFTTPLEDSINGYYAKIITVRKGEVNTFEFVVTPNFKILCPVFMLE